MTVWFNAEGTSLYHGKRSITGDVMVFTEPVKFESSFDPRSGKVILPKSEHFGKSIRNKIIVAPAVTYHSDLEFLVYLLEKHRCKPKGFIIKRASSSLILGAVLADIPIIYGFTEGSFDMLTTGEALTIDFERKAVRKK